MFPSNHVRGGRPAKRKETFTGSTGRHLEFNKWEWNGLALSNQVDPHNKAITYSILKPKRLNELLEKGLINIDLSVIAYQQLRLSETFFKMFPHFWAGCSTCFPSLTT